MRFLPGAQDEVELQMRVVVAHRREARDLDRVRPDLLGDAVPFLEEGNETVDVGSVLDSNSHGGLSLVFGTAACGRQPAYE